MPPKEETIEHDDTHEKHCKENRAWPSLNIYSMHLNSGHTLAILKKFKNLSEYAAICQLIPLSGGSQV